MTQTLISNKDNFVVGTATALANLPGIPPAGAYYAEIDTGLVRCGDGTTAYADLPTADSEDAFALLAKPVITIPFGASDGGSSTGLDYSANNPALPNIGAAFGATGPYPNYVLLTTVPASTGRKNVDIENTSGGQIVIIRDDGTAAPGAAPANASIFALSGGSAVGAQGGSWSSTTFKGRLQIYGPTAGLQVAAMVD